MAAPEGNKNAKKGREWSEAVRKELLSIAEGDKKKIHKVAEKLVSMAMGGDIHAIKECGDRLDGKSVAVVEGNIEHDYIIQVIEFTPCDSPTIGNRETIN